MTFQVRVTTVTTVTVEAVDGDAARIEATRYVSGRTSTGVIRASLPRLAGTTIDSTPQDERGSRSPISCPQEHPGDICSDCGECTRCSWHARGCSAVT